MSAAKSWRDCSVSTGMKLPGRASCYRPSPQALEDRNLEQHTQGCLGASGNEAGRPDQGTIWLEAPTKRRRDFNPQPRNHSHPPPAQTLTKGKEEAPRRGASDL